MPDTQQSGMAIAPDVLDTIIALAIKDVEGVASVGAQAPKLLNLFNKQDQQGVAVSQIADNAIDVSVKCTVIDGYSPLKIASDMRSAIADAILSQTGFQVNRVDIYVDGILFQD